jgi:hypothetical protein
MYRQTRRDRKLYRKDERDEHTKTLIHFEQTQEEKDTQTRLNERGIGLTFSSRKNNL